MSHWPVGLEVVDELRASKSHESLLSDGSTAYRVGRNLVWHLITGQGHSYFVKLCRDGDDFSRQVFGLNLSQDIAAADSRFMAADIVAVDPRRLLIVTRPIGGALVSALFSKAFRVDRNPLWRTPARVGAREALGMVATWLNALHARPADANVPLYDHSREAAWKRTALKLDALSLTAPSLSRHVGFSRRWRFVARPGDKSLVFGDATMANFFVSNGRVGAVDFEDVGLGPVSRDWATLENDVRQAFRNIHYRTDRQALDQVSCSPDVTRDVVLLELTVNRLEHDLPLGGLLAACRRRAACSRVERFISALVCAGAIERCPS